MCEPGPGTPGDPTSHLLPPNGTPSHHLGHRDRGSAQNFSPEAGVGVPPPQSQRFLPIRTHKCQDVSFLEQKNGHQRPRGFGAMGRSAWHHVPIPSLWAIFRFFDWLSLHSVMLLPSTQAPPRITTSLGALGHISAAREAREGRLATLPTFPVWLVWGLEGPALTCAAAQMTSGRPLSLLFTCMSPLRPPETSGRQVVVQSARISGGFATPTPPPPLSLISGVQ